MHGFSNVFSYEAHNLQLPCIVLYQYYTTAQMPVVSDHEFELRQATLLGQLSVVIASVRAFKLGKRPPAYEDTPLSPHQGRVPGAKTKKRLRRDMDDMFMSMDSHSFKRRYRMDKQSFYDLLDIIGDHIPSTGENLIKGVVPNGPITHTARLSMALRYFAAGGKFDIADVHGVHADEVGRSVWDVVDAIHKSPALDINFPETHHQQMEVMEGFKRKSSVDIDCCVGAIDGILIWTHKPSSADIKVIKFGPLKFFCGRKMKYGLNMMAVCDSRGRFLWVEVRFPGASSDYYAFDESYLKEKLERKGFLRAGLCLFDDNAYVNTPYMCSPWRNVSGGPKDGFNFFHSQLRINIESAFGIIVHRWGVLQKPIAVNVSIKRTTSLVVALCKLNNYCITRGDVSAEPPIGSDAVNIVSEGGLYLPRLDASGQGEWQYDMNLAHSRDRVQDLLDGGQHMDDHTRSASRKYRRERDLPCHVMLRDFVLKHYHRPEISRMRKNNR